MTTREPLHLGLDLGSTAVKAALLRRDGTVLATEYLRHSGRPLVAASELLRRLLDRPLPDNPSAVVTAIAVTGAAGRPLAQAIGAAFFNEVVALGAAMKRLHPEFRTAIEVGGQDAKIVELCGDEAKVVAGESQDETAHADNRKADRDGQAFRDFAMNSECAAGTGSFLDQQASRLGLSIEQEFGALALKSRKPPRVAGRCSVFAKSDMIHLQQQAVADYDIVAGLCCGMARNFKATLARGRDLQLPIAFVGGVASNAGMVRAFREVFELSGETFRVPPHSNVLPAIGAALLLQAAEAGDAAAGSSEHAAADSKGAATKRATAKSTAVTVDPAVLTQLLSHREPPADRQAPLREPRGYLASELAPAPPAGQICDVYLGLDVGSISTNLVLLDAQARLLDKLYIMTAGRPIEAVRAGLKALGRKWAGRVRVLGAASTGSGRYLTGDIIGADVVRNEITCQACGAAHVVPDVDTIFEIGGQDSKFISLRGGVVVDFEMNHVCAAGTGSFLEEQAERLGISIKDEFARLALLSRSPVRLGERCTVFMESDLSHHQQQGVRLEDLVAGLSYSIAANYLNRVVGTRQVGHRILFQGGTAFNRAVTSAFEALTGHPITVPPHHEVTGAIGAAILARRAHQDGRFAATKFRGFELADRPYELRSFTCSSCSNYCEIREVRLEGEAPLFYGSRCDRYNKKSGTAAGRSAETDSPLRWPDLFAERQRALLGLPADAPAAAAQAAVRSAPAGPGLPRGVIGLPRALTFHQLTPFFRTLFNELGYEVLISPATDAAIIHSGVESVLSQVCFPVKVAHGHVRWLSEAGVDYVFLPSIITLPRDHASQDHNYLCPYIQTIPYQVESALGLAAGGVKLLSPALNLEDGYESCLEGFLEWSGRLAVSAGEIERALKSAVAAQQRFEDFCVARGREVLGSPPAGAIPTIVISRPYNGCDPAVNLDLPRRMADVGLLPVPMDFLDLRQADLGDDWRNLFWKYGQKIIRAGQLLRDRPEVQAVYLSNFGCGPDSFLRRFFQEAIGHRPILSLEVDEHSAPAGQITRLEAFVDSLTGSRQVAERGTAAMGAPPARTAPTHPPIFKPHGRLDGRTIFVPNMCDHAYAFAAAFRGAGLAAAVIPPSDDLSLALGRQFTSGRECLPCIVTTGDMLRELRRPGADPRQMAFFMPSGTGPCRFGMYSKLHRLILQAAGYDDVPVLSPNQGESFYQDFKKLPRDPTRAAWQGIVAIDVLTKAVHATRPYESVPGATDAVYQRCLSAVSAALERREHPAEAMQWSANLFRQVATTGRPRRPRVGIVGEIYVRSHSFSNQDLVRRLEALGLEVELAAFSEWIFYTNWTRLRRTRQRGQYRRWLGTWIKEQVQRHDERRVSQPFAGLVDELREPPSGELVAAGNRYIHNSFEGEAIISLGKAWQMASPAGGARDGHGDGHSHGHQANGVAPAAGIINVMPFTCMPGNIVAATLKRLRSDLGHLPVLSISYDGQRDASLDIRLEAFAEQVKSFAVEQGR